MDPPPDSSSSPHVSDAQVEEHAPPLPVSLGQTLPKLRLMCSYGGHIVPRPNDKSLCYVGGDTRIVMVDRHSVSLSYLHARLSSTLLNGRKFVLKYQLPNEDLDSLISVTTEEDVENMLDEYDRTVSASRTTGTASSRLRLFLFPLKLESSQSLLDNGVVKGGDDWFISELNGANNLNRGFSDSVVSSVNCLLGLDDPHLISGGEGNTREAEGLNANCGGVGKKQDTNSVPDSPMLETTSSFGSTSSSPSLANLPPIKVHVTDDQKAAGIEEQFSQVNLASSGGVKSEEGFMVISSPPPLPVSIVPIATTGTAEYRDRVYSDDERSDHGGIGYRKQPVASHPPVQSQPQSQPQPSPPQKVPSSQDLNSQGQLKATTGPGIVDSPSPDSLTSENNLGNPMNRMKPMIIQEPPVQIPPITTRPPTTTDAKSHLPELGRVPTQQPQDSGYILQPQFDQTQFIHPQPHYIHHPGGAVPLPTYYPLSAYPPQQQQQQQPQQQQYPIYYMSARPQPFNLPVPHSINESAPQPPPTMVAPQSGYIPIRPPSTNPEITTTTPYRIPSSTSTQHAPQFIPYSQLHHPQSNYGYEILDPSHAKLFYAPQMAPQYQTITSTPPSVLPEPSPQISAPDNIKHQARTSQPI